MANSQALPNGTCSNKSVKCLNATKSFPGCDGETNAEEYDLMFVSEEFESESDVAGHHWFGIESNGMLELISLLDDVHVSVQGVSPLYG